MRIGPLVAPFYIESILRYQIDLWSNQRSPSVAKERVIHHHHQCHSMNMWGRERKAMINKGEIKQRTNKSDNLPNGYKEAMGGKHQSRKEVRELIVHDKIERSFAASFRYGHTHQIYRSFYHKMCISSLNFKILNCSKFIFL